MTIKKIKREITETIIFSIVHLIAANDKRRNALKKATMQFHQKSSYASSNSRQMTTMARMRMRKWSRFHGTCLWYCACVGLNQSAFLIFATEYVLFLLPL